MAEESRSQGASTARWLAVGGALVTGVTGITGIVMAGFSLVGGEETGAGALLAASALAFGFLAANLDRSSERGPLTDSYRAMISADGASKGEAEAQPLTAAAVAAPAQTGAPRMNDGPSLRHRLPEDGEYRCRAREPEGVGGTIPCGGGLLQQAHQR